MKAEGLFRVPPHSKLRDVLKEAYDRGQKFIVWKDNGAMLPLPLYPRAENQNEILAEIDPRDAYSVFMAAALIKAWYANLRQPIFPQSSYRDLKRLYGDPDDVPGLDRLRDLFSPSSQWSFLPAISREIVARHLLPLLSAVAARQEQNKMNPENLAVCIAPALLCGPDQLEDAKMSSIIRRILTEAIDIWPHGLREACGQTEAAFKEDIQLPHDERDWEDPLEGRMRTDERQSWDENQSSGIILQDNESLGVSDKGDSHLPPLPPRTGIATGRSSVDSVTKRKPAPPLQVPPRYSTIVSDSPTDTTESPISQAATTDGFAPHRERQEPAASFPDEKKSGTSFGNSSAPPQIILPKRKALTAQQIDNAEHAVAEAQARKASGEYEREEIQAPRPSEMKGKALPGLADLHIQKTPPAPPLKRKAVPSGSYPVEEKNSPTSTTATASPTLVSVAPVNEFRRPSLPASASRAPNITSLARPVLPTINPVTNRPPSKSTSLPIPGPKPRTPSPALLQRMPSFEQSKKEPRLAPPSTPRRLNLKKQSVDDLRRLYEERAGTASALIEAAKKR